MKKLIYKILILVLFLYLLGCKKEISDSENLEPISFDPNRQIEIRILWEKKNFPLEMELYEGASQRPVELWATGSVGDLSEAPVSSKIEGSELYLKPGSKKRFVLVVKNTTEQDFYFFAAPHSMEPPEVSLGFKFKCLCVNHAFYIPPRETWFRVVELRVGGEAFGKELKISHTLVGMNEERLRLYQKGVGADTTGEN
ncbi:hypothetical protein [Leptospira sp. P2653]|uniref:LIC11469 family lipoprotein adhesin Lsa20 n=1 Tax=Leptospira sp. P2653 TaxID=1218600 RepID=UPI0002BD50FB|nr:hypothetical protein [Leptospira sp. P2653]EMJ60831.1 hypothetical protein LEP1GSC051_3567 [Leptospira sp. P2653]